LDICYWAFSQVFAYAVIHTVKRRRGLVLRSEAVYNMSTI
jgi:hypothetical protein